VRCKPLEGSRRPISAFTNRCPRLSLTDSYFGTHVSNAQPTWSSVASWWLNLSGRFPCITRH
jgi:hypothetical protein